MRKTSSLLLPAPILFGSYCMPFAQPGLPAGRAADGIVRPPAPAIEVWSAGIPVAADLSTGLPSESDRIAWQSALPAVPGSSMSAHIVAAADTQGIHIDHVW